MKLFQISEKTILELKFYDNEKIIATDIYVIKNINDDYNNDHFRDFSETV